MVKHLYLMNLVNSLKLVYKKWHIGIQMCNVKSYNNYTKCGEELCNVHYAQFRMLCVGRFAESHHTPRDRSRHSRHSYLKGDGS